MTEHTIAFQGTFGAYSDLACRRVFPEMATLPCTQFDDAFAAVSEGRAALAMIAVENSVAGRVADVHHLMPDSDLHIIGEHFERVNHHLLAVPEATLETLRTVRSHVHALSQCRRLIRSLGLEPIIAADTAGAAAEIAARGDPTIAAIASELAGQIYGLVSLKENIEDAEHNTTRFLIMSRQPKRPARGSPTVTTFLFRVRNVPAALYKALGGFATNGVNMTKLESYMVGGAFAATQFYADVEAHPEDRSLTLALEELAFFSREVKILGVYPAHPLRIARLGARWKLTEETDMIVIDHAALHDIAERIFTAAGSDPDEARTIADYLVEANLRGHDSHGVGLIPNYLQHLAGGSVFANRKGRVVSENGSLFVYDGERAWGQIAAREATLIGIAKARETGVAVVALRNPHHIGRVGKYGEMCAEAGLVSFHFVNVTDARPAVAPWRGTDARFSTNPVCIAIPGPEPERPIILDMATSVVAMGKVRVARNKGEQLKPGILLDGEGKPTTDPGAMYRQPRGALMTFGEHKGYALAFVCEMLAGALCGSGTMSPERQGAGTATNGMLTIVIDPARLVDREWLRDEIAAMTRYITASPPRHPDEPVLIPGDPERLSRAERIKNGVPIDDETWRELTVAARSVNVLVEAPP